MSYTLEQLAAFVAAADGGSFSEAGRQLGKSQSSISTLIGNLEIEFDFELFDRKARCPSLTEKGEALYRDAAVLVRSAKSMQHKVDGINAGVEERIAIAFDESAIRAFAACKNHQIRFKGPEKELQSSIAASENVPLYTTLRSSSF